MRSVLPRLQLVELMDLPWFPDWLRRYQTDLLVFAWRCLAPRDEISGQLGELLSPSGDTLVDLCSGSGGLATRLVRDVRERGHASLRLILTDLYPHTELSTEDGVSYWPEPVDARAIGPDLQGVRTLFAGLHHFPPEEAAAILADARRSRQPIAVYELTTRTVRCLVLILLQALFGTLIFTPFIRPFSGRRLLLTYLLPLVSATLVVDGVVSVFRSYSPQELLAMAGGDGDPDYRWRAGTVGGALVPIVYLLGEPRDAPVDR